MCSEEYGTKTEDLDAEDMGLKSCTQQRTPCLVEMLQTERFHDEKENK